MVDMPRVPDGRAGVYKVGGIRNWLPYIINDELVILSPYLYDLIEAFNESCNL
jgi:hypothetical protein